MRHPTPVLLLAILLRVGLSPAAEIVESDICVYGGTSGGIVAAVQAVRMGKSVSLPVFGTHLGGLTTGGLGATDVGTIGSIGGLSREFYRRIGKEYGVAERFQFEPHVARKVYEAWLLEYGITPRWNQRLAAVTRSGQRIVQLTMEDGTIYRARMFIDATYEGDLIAMAGVSFTFGREGTNVYGESLNGIRANTPAHQFTVNVDPYVIPGNPASGLLPFIQSGDGGTPGDGDYRIQAYNYRLCFTQNATNKLPHAVPSNYNPARYELLGRLLDARVAAGETLRMNQFFGISSMPNGKTDMNNNGAFSTDFIGANWTYPTNTYAERARLDREHLEYIQGYVYYLASSPRSPASLRNEVLSWGPCKDEWPETGGYSPQIYVREARRMLGDYVMTQSDCDGSRLPPDSVCLGSYTMDSHNCQRIVKNGYARNEGDVQVRVPKPYPISYRSIVPKAGECENVFVTFAISATHIAFGSTRMEPVFMMASQSAATAAAFAIDDQVPVQQVDYAKLALQLRLDGQVLTWGAGEDAPGSVTVDNTDPGVAYSGIWSNSASVSGYWGANYAHDDNLQKGTKTATYSPNLPAADTYKVYLRWTSHANRATNVPVDILHPAGTTTVSVDQTQNNATWVLLLTTNFDAGAKPGLRIRTDQTSGYVVADAARWVPVSHLPQVQVIATKGVASESGRIGTFTMIRSPDLTNVSTTVRFRLSGSATNAEDYQAVAETLVIPAGAIAGQLEIRPVGDSSPEGEETVVLSILPGPEYAAGAVSNAVVRILDTPLDQWRFEHFSPSQLQDSSVSGPHADPDQDGQTNLQEFRARTDPLDPASVLRVQIQAQPDGAKLTFPASPNNSYSLQARESFTHGAWTELTNFPPSETSGTQSYTDSAPVLSNRFYRVVAP